MHLDHVDARPTRWRTYLGLVLVPLLVAVGLLGATWNSDTRLHRVEAAVVNLDDGVTIDDRFIPLGRQLTAALVDSDREQNFAWVLADKPTATQGIASGRYAAMVVIPKNFSKAATSYSRDADKAHRATITVQTSPVAGVADATLGKVVAHAAAQTLNETLTKAYLDAIYIGFNDMGDQFVTLADGTAELADGAGKLADGIGKASDGAQQLYSGARQLADGLGTMAEETKPLPKGARALATGADDLADGTKTYVAGVNQLVDSTIASAEQLPSLISGISQSAQGAAGMSSGLGSYRSAMEGLTHDPTMSGAISCPDALQQAGMCDAFYAGVATGGGVAAAGLTTKDSSTGQSLLSGAEALDAGLAQIAAGVSGMGGSADQISQLKQLRDGGTALAKGARQLASGADSLADGMPALIDGIGKASDGSSQLADGVDQLGAGLIKAASGGTKLADGTRELADGVAEGRDKLPSYSSSQRQTLSAVVASPIATDALEGIATADLGWASLLLVLSLWLGALATYLVVRALGTRLLTSSRPTSWLIGRSLLPGLVVAAIQAVVLGAVGQWALGLPLPKLVAVVGILLLAGWAFVAVNHALVAWLGGLGRLVSVGFAVLSTAAALTSAAPGFFDALRPFSPLTPALDAIRAVVTDSSGATTAAFGLVGWLIVAVSASAIAIARRRTTTFEALVAAAG